MNIHTDHSLFPFFGGVAAAFSTETSWISALAIFGCGRAAVISVHRLPTAAWTAA